MLGSLAGDPNFYSLVLIHGLHVDIGVVAGSDAHLVSPAPGITSISINWGDIAAGVITLANTNAIVTGLVIAGALVIDDA